MGVVLSSAYETCLKFARRRRPQRVMLSAYEARPRLARRHASPSRLVPASKLQDDAAACTVPGSACTSSATGALDLWRAARLPVLHAFFHARKAVANLPTCLMRASTSSSCCLSAGPISKVHLPVWCAGYDRRYGGGVLFGQPRAGWLEESKRSHGRAQTSTDQHLPARTSGPLHEAPHSFTLLARSPKCWRG